MPGAAPIGVPNFFIDKFRIPPFLLPLYQAAGIEYGVRWEVLAAINEIETDYGRNLNVSTAGALGWMQFMPATWKQYGVDANKDDLKDPYNPADAIFAAARYLKAAGAEQDLRKAIFAYNHADWYVDSVLMRARLIGGLPSNLVGSLTGLTQGHFPVAAKATYADDLSEAEAKKLGKRSRKAGNRALVVEGSEAPPRDQGVRPPRRAGRSPSTTARSSASARPSASANFIQLQDLRQHLHVRAPGQGREDLPRAAPAHDDRQGRSPRSSSCRPRTPRRPRPPPRPPRRRRSARRAKPNRRDAGKTVAKPRPAGAGHHQAAPVRPPARPNAGRAGGKQQEFERTGKIDGASSFKSYFSKVFGLDRKDVRIKRLRPGSRVVAGTILGRIGQTSSDAGAARAVRDPPGRPRRPAHRSEADPRRLEAARVDRDLPRRRQEPVLRPRRQAADDRPDPADEQGGAGPARARQPAHRDLRLRARRHPHGPGRPPRARHARVPRRLGHAPDRVDAEVRPRGC